MVAKFESQSHILRVGIEESWSSNINIVHRNLKEQTSQLGLTMPKAVWLLLELSLVVEPSFFLCEGYRVLNAGTMGFGGSAAMVHGKNDFQQTVLRRLRPYSWGDEKGGRLVARTFAPEWPATWSTHIAGLSRSAGFPQVKSHHVPLVNRIAQD